MSRFLRAIAGLYSHERPLFLTGVLGIALGAICFIGIAFHGVIVEPEGNLYKAATFDIAAAVLLAWALILARALLAFRWSGARLDFLAA